MVAIAMNANDPTDNLTVEKVLPSMKNIDENAEYYSLLGEHVRLFILTDEQLADVKDTDWKYIINGKVYRTIGTNTLEYFMSDLPNQGN